MNLATDLAQRSHCVKAQVGAVLTKDTRIISIGYNGMPIGWDNNCEDYYGLDLKGNPTLVTKPEVLHAETNAIAKLAKSNESGLGATMFITHAPCLDCAKLIYQSARN